MFGFSTVVQGQQWSRFVEKETEKCISHKTSNRKGLGIVALKPESRSSIPSLLFFLRQHPLFGINVWHYRTEDLLQFICLEHFYKALSTAYLYYSTCKISNIKGHLHIGLSDSHASLLEFFFIMSRSSPRVMLSKIVQGWSGRSRGYHGCWKNLFISLLSSFLLTSHSSLLFSLFFIIFLSIHFLSTPPPPLWLHCSLQFLPQIQQK